MNDLLERYLGAVCTYFFGKKRKQVYNDLKKNIQSSVSHYDDMEDLLIQYGHPRSVALSYGYRPIIIHVFNKKITSKVEKNLFISSGIYLFFSTLYYLHQFNCLPFFTSSQVSSTINSSSFITWFLSHPFYILGGIFLFSFIFLILKDHKHPAKQTKELFWNKKKLNDLPHQSHYPDHSIESYLMLIFIIFFTIYSFIFSTPLIIEVQHASYQMIHLMIYFFQPFILMILVDYIIDMTKRKYTRKYLFYSSFINLFIFLSLTVFIINSSFLKDYLLPFDRSYEYLLINILIIIALLFIYLIVLYKLVRNFKSYRSLFRK